MCYVLDEVSVVKVPLDEAASGAEKPVDFKASYFAVMDVGLTPTIVSHPSAGWFTLAMTGGHKYEKRFAYGFRARGIALSPPSTPVPGYPNPAQAHKTFSWQTERCKNLRAIHLFTLGSQTDDDGFSLQQVHI
jgi:hypothetical protein